MPHKQDQHAPQRLGVEFIGSGFNARFHMQAFGAVRGVWTPNTAHAATANRAGQRKTLTFPPRGPDGFVPAVAQGKWKP